MGWYHVSNADRAARLMADRHYSRQSPGSTHFLPPGNNICLITPASDAIWSINRNAPDSGVIRMDGYKCWSNTIFRNESQSRASDLILSAIAVCVYLWCDIPADGLHTFIDARKVKPTIRRGARTFGYCYLKAGFEYVGNTKDKDLMRFVLSAVKLRAITPAAPLNKQLLPFVV